MSKKLVIVESPSKAKTIQKYLGDDYIIESSYGHVRDLPKKDISIDVSNNFEPNYVVSDDKKEVVKKLKKLLTANGPQEMKNMMAQMANLSSTDKKPDGGRSNY